MTARLATRIGRTPLKNPLIAAAAEHMIDEEGVRRAILAGKKLVVSERAIVTPAARDLGEQHRVFTFSPWRG